MKATLGGSARGLAVEMILSRAEGLERARTSPPELVVIEGTDDDALETVEALADDPRTDALPVLVVGDAESVAGADRIIALGARLVAPAELSLRHAIDETLALRVHLGGLHALIADDDLAVTRLLGDLLRAQGCSVEEAHDGNAALERALANAPDLVMTDLRMPGLRGEDLVRHMREDAVLRDVPVLLLSWKDDWLAEARSSGIEVSGFLTKQAAPETVLTSLRSALAVRRDLEARLAGQASVRGRLEELTPHRLVSIVSRLRGNSRISVRDGAGLYDVQLRDGAPRASTHVSGYGAVIRGPAAFEALLGLRAGRFIVAPEQGSVQSELAGSLASQLASHLPKLRSSAQPTPTTGADPIIEPTRPTRTPQESAPAATQRPDHACVAPRAPAPAVIDASTQPMFLQRPVEPVHVTLRLPPVRRPEAAPPPPHASACAREPGAERTVPMPHPAAARPTQLPAIERPSRGRAAASVLLRMAAVLAVAASGLAIGAGLRVYQSAQSAELAGSVAPRSPAGGP